MSRNFICSSNESQSDVMLTTCDQMLTQVKEDRASGAGNKIYLHGTAMTRARAAGTKGGAGQRLT